MDSSLAVCVRFSEVSPELDRHTYKATYAPFTPNNSEQRSPLTYYRGCWHVISRGLFPWYRQVDLRPPFFPKKRTLQPEKAFIIHAASLRQAFAHCGRFLAAASRRSLGRVSVPMWPVTLSSRLPIVALVGHYPTNKLMGRSPLLCR